MIACEIMSECLHLRLDYTLRERESESARTYLQVKGFPKIHNVLGDAKPELVKSLLRDLKMMVDIVFYG
jgi:hypothetical protein